MTVYLALLRGVNVGGKARLAMSELRALYEAMGFEDVRTFIQSGNVVFSSNSAPVASELEAAVEKRFKIESPTIVRTAADLDRIIRNDPFPDADRKHVHVGFMAKELSEAALHGLDLERFEPERIAVVGSEIYFRLPLGMGQSKLASFVSRKLTVPLTIRNWNTVVALAALAAT
jgi:uncharacterized protein (DUF1697 family)